MPADLLDITGTIKHQLLDALGNEISSGESENLIATVGLHMMFDVMFNGGTASTTWYMMLVDNSGFSAFANADTMASHGGWTENQQYTEATRPEWTADAAATRAIGNSTTVDFSINATATIEGIAVADVNTKGGATGNLWNGGSFSSPQAVSSGQTLKITYTVNGPA